MQGGEGVGLGVEGVAEDVAGRALALELVLERHAGDALRPQCRACGGCLGAGRRPAPRAPRRGPPSASATAARTCRELARVRPTSSASRADSSPRACSSADSRLRSPALPPGDRAVARLEPAAEVAADVVEVGGRRDRLRAGAPQLVGQAGRARPHGTPERRPERRAPPAAPRRTPRGPRARAAAPSRSCARPRPRASAAATRASGAARPPPRRGRRPERAAGARRAGPAARASRACSASASRSAASASTRCSSSPPRISSASRARSASEATRAWACSAASARRARRSASTARSMTSPPGSGSATGTLNGAARSSSPAGVGSADRSPLSHSSHSPARATASGTRYAPRQIAPPVRVLGASGSESTRDTAPPTCSAQHRQPERVPHADRPPPAHAQEARVGARGQPLDRLQREAVEDRGRDRFRHRGRWSQTHRRVRKGPALCGRALVGGVALGDARGRRRPRPPRRAPTSTRAGM